MDTEELAALHRRNEYAHAAIKECVHDLASRCCTDRSHSRIELQLLQLSQRMTEQARQLRSPQPDQPSS